MMKRFVRHDFRFTAIAAYSELSGKSADMYHTNSSPYIKKYNSYQYQMLNE